MRVRQRTQAADGVENQCQRHLVPLTPPPGEPLAVGIRQVAGRGRPGADPKQHLDRPGTFLADLGGHATPAQVPGQVGLEGLALLEHLPRPAW